MPSILPSRAFLLAALGLLATAIPVERALLGLAAPGGLAVVPYVLAKDDGRGGRSGSDDSDSGSDDRGGSGSSSSDDGGSSGRDADNRSNDDSGRGSDDGSGHEDDGSKDGSGGTPAARDERRGAATGRPGAWPRSGGNDRDGSDDLLAVDLGPAELRRAEAQGFRVRERRTLGNLGLTVTRLAPPPGLGSGPALDRLRALLPNRTLAPDDSYRPQADDGCGGRCWAASLIGWPREPSACGRGAVIGLVDTRVELPAVIVAGEFQDRSFVPLGAPLAPPGHGTAVASILVGGADRTVPALVPAARLVVADVFAAEASGGMRAGALEIAAALDWLAGRGTSVVNASFAGPDNPVLAAAVARMLRRGIPIVAAAGNGGAEAPPAYPAAYPGVIAVTAVDRTLQPYRRANRGSYIAFAAPGVDVPTRGGTGPALRSGTSYAAAFVTAALAALAARAPLPPAEAERRLAAVAQDLGPPGRDPVFGWGLVRASGTCVGAS